MRYVYALSAAVDACFSPDENVWYLVDFAAGGRASLDVYPHLADARQAFEKDAVTWEEVST